MKRAMASIPIEKHRARRKTPLIKAPKTSARCHPYESVADAEEFSASLRA
jgi:hypothetical protein